MEYLFYNTMTSKTPCEKQLEGDFMNTLQIDSVRVQPGYINPAVDFNNLYFVVAPGVKIKVKHEAVSGVSSALDLATVLHISPNPAQDWATVTIQDEHFHAYFYRVFDLNGQLLWQDKVTGDVFKIPRRNAAAGIYCLEVVDKTGRIAASKIIFQEN